MTGRLTGLGALVRLTARRNRWFYLAWVLGLAAVVPATATAYETIIDPDNADLLIATMSGNPTMRAMLGPPTDLGTAGGFTVWRVGTFIATMAGLMAVLGVVRSTRAEEEEGRVELLRSGVVGRHSPSPPASSSPSARSPSSAASSRRPWPPWAPRSPDRWRSEPGWRWSVRSSPGSAR